MKRYILTVTLQEDLHTGSGTGAGEYDALLSRDRNGNPVIPFTHWQGVWKYNLKRYLEAKKQPLDDCNALFGRENQQRGLLNGTALYSKNIIDSLSWTSSSRKQYSRTTEENTLRVKEFIPAGTRFTATLWLADKSLEKSLNVACRITDVLGARRQRGDGRIHAELKEATISSKETTQNQQSTTLKLLLRANDPLCLPTTGHPGNIIESECYLRGQVLRGAIIGKLLRDKKNVLASSLFGVDFKVSNAYPLPHTCLNNTDDLLNSDALPMPLNFNQPKAQGGNTKGLPWWAQNITTPAMHNRFSGEQFSEKLKRPADNAFIFKQVTAKTWQSYTAPLAMRMRNAQPSIKHPNGALFSQQEIPENTLFLSEITCSDNHKAQQLLVELSDVFSGYECLTIGRGGSPVTIESWRFKTDPQYSETQQQHSDTLTITLTSDLIARSPELGFYQTLTPDVLFELCELQEKSPADWQTQSFTDQIEIYGFNAMSGLPRLPALAIRRGSALSIKGENINQLRQALTQRKVLGERIEEGFGQFRIDFTPALAENQIKQQALSVNEKETVFAHAEAAFNRLPKENIIAWPKLSQWQALRFNETHDGASLVNLLEKHQHRLETKQEAIAHIAWLKKMPNREITWIAWLIKQMDELPSEQQRPFYKALLVYIHCELRTSESA